MDVAVVVALAPLPVRCQEVEGVGSGCRPLRSLLVPARAGCSGGLLTATARGVWGSRSRCDQSRSLDRYRAHRDRLWRDRWCSVDHSRSRHQRTRFSLPAGEIGVTASGRTLSRIARVTARGQAGDYLVLLPACGRRSQDGWPNEKPRRVLGRLPRSLLWFLKRQRLSLLLQEGRFSPRFRLIGRVLPGVFEPVRILFPVAIGGIEGMTASAAGSGGAVCPSTAAAGAVTVGAATAMPAGAGDPPAPATVHGVPGVAWCAWRAWSYALTGDFPL